MFMASRGPWLQNEPMRRFLPFLAAAAAFACSAVTSTAYACGGCFHPPPNVNETPSVVVDHRMAFSISKTQAILWDQGRYAVNPPELSLGLPVRSRSARRSVPSE